MVDPAAYQLQRPYLNGHLLTLLAFAGKRKPPLRSRTEGLSEEAGRMPATTPAYSLLEAQPRKSSDMRTQDTNSARESSSAPRTNSTARSEPPPLDVDRARRAWSVAVTKHPKLRGARALGMQLVALQLAMTVCYDPRAADYGRCWPTAATLAEWCGLSRRGVRKALRGLEALGILTVTDRRPMSNLYALDVGIDPWEYYSPSPVDKLQPELNGGFNRNPTGGSVPIANRNPTGGSVPIANRNPTGGSVPIEPEPNGGFSSYRTNRTKIKPTRTGTSRTERDVPVPCFEGGEAAPSVPNGVPHSGAAQQALKRNGAAEKRDTKEVRYLRNLHIHAKDVYEIALEHPDMAWQCMTTWGDEGGEIEGVLVERLRRIPEQAAAAQVKAQKMREEKRLKAAQVAAHDAALEAEEVQGAALRELNRERLALLSGAQQVVARQGAIERFRGAGDWRWLYDAYRAPIKRAAASTADWDALPGAVLPRKLEEYLALALDALDEGELAVLPQDGDPPVAMGLYGPVVGAVEQVEAPARNGRVPYSPAAEPV